MRDKQKIKALIAQCRAARRAFEENRDVANFNACIAADNALWEELHKTEIQKNACRVG